MKNKRTAFIIVAVFIAVIGVFAGISKDEHTAVNLGASDVAVSSDTASGIYGGKGETVTYSNNGAVSDRAEYWESVANAASSLKDSHSQSTDSHGKEFDNAVSDSVKNADKNYKLNYKDIPAFSNKPYFVVNGNVPALKVSDRTAKYFEKYSVLDSYGRCGVAYACLGKETMPTEERGSIGQVKPSGWKTVKYDCVDGKYLYNRCHLIGFQLSGENANKRNLITGTRYMNIEGMLPFENMVADYIEETGNHVLYRVTPVFIDDELVARGVQMEALSVEDNGDGICFNVFCYNSQPEVIIDYATGNSSLA